MARTRTLLLALFLALVVTGPVAAEPWAYDLAAELMSPYCPGRTLASCPSPQAAELVQWMVLQEASGSSQEEVVAILIERFGEEILGAPPARGITLWAYVFPILGFVVGGGLVAVAFRRIVAGGGPAQASKAQAPRTPGMPPTDLPAASPGPAPSGASRTTDEELARLVDADLAARG